MGILTVDTDGNGDFASLGDAIAALSGMPDLTEWWTISCSGGRDYVGGIGVQFDNNPDGYPIYIEPGPGNFHGGVWDGGRYYIVTAATGFRLLSPFIRVRYIQIKTEDTGYNANGFGLHSEDVSVDSCLIWYDGSGNSAYTGVASTTTYDRMWAKNCILFGGWDIGVRLGGPTRNESGALNCTAVDCVSVSFASNGYQQAMYSNCISSGPALGIQNASPDRQSNITEDTSGDIQGVVVFKDRGAGDYHLSELDTIAIGAGLDLSEYFTNDIDGQTRTIPWDIGADQYDAGGPPAGEEALPVAVDVAVGVLPATAGTEGGEAQPGLVGVVVDALPATAGSGVDDVTPGVVVVQVAVLTASAEAGVGDVPAGVVPVEVAVLEAIARTEIEGGLPWCPPDDTYRMIEAKDEDYSPMRQDADTYKPCGSKR